jgi:hypothetical protein
MKKSVISFNKTIVDKLFLHNKIPQKYLANDSSIIFESYKKNFPVNKFFYDRTGSIPHYINIDKDAFPIPKLNPAFNKTFYDVAEERALELLSLGKPINVSWSGGIDSTFVLFTLYNNANDKSQIKVYGTYNSIIESGDLFDRFIKDKIKFDIHTNLEYYENFNVPKNEIVVTGCMGNDLFYPGIKYGLRDTWMTFVNTLDPNANIKQYWDKPYTDVLREENLIFLNELISKSPNEIETLQDLRFWVSFTCNWYTTNTNRYIGIGSERSTRVFSFFNTPEFQNWSLFNNEPKTKTGDYSDERWQQREYIKEFCGDSYSSNKAKFTSTLSNLDSWMFLLNDYSNVYLENLNL